MVLFTRSESGKHVSEEWHQQRQRAREIGFSLDEFSDEEITKYDLDTADITGKDNPRTYMFSTAIDIFGVNGLDVRSLDEQ